MQIKTKKYMHARMGCDKTTSVSEIKRERERERAREREEKQEQKQRCTTRRIQCQ